MVHVACSRASMCQQSSIIYNRDGTDYSVGLKNVLYNYLIFVKDHLHQGE